MASYRFCRTDDVPLLVAAHERCFRPHVPGLFPLTVERFRRWIRALDLWCSSCMVAHDGKDAVGVLLAGKREDENLVFRIGVHPEHLRRGHGGHLLESLSAKLAILGPPRITAEVPADNGGARRFFEGAGFVAETTWVDYRLEPGGDLPDPPPGLLVPVTVADLEADGILAQDRPAAWARAPRALRRSADDLQGVAVASDRIEAYAVYRDEEEGARTVWGLGCSDLGRRDPLLGMLLGACASGTRGDFRIPRVAPDELPASAATRWGFRPAAKHVLYAATATPA